MVNRDDVKDIILVPYLDFGIAEKWWCYIWGGLQSHGLLRFVCLSVCLSVCFILSLCLFVCLVSVMLAVCHCVFVCLSVSLSVWCWPFLIVCLSVCVIVSLCRWLMSSLHVSWCSFLHSFILRSWFHAACPRSPDNSLTAVPGISALCNNLHFYFTSELV